MERLKISILFLIWGIFITVNLLVFVVGGPDFSSYVLNLPDKVESISSVSWLRHQIIVTELTSFGWTQVGFLTYLLIFDVILTMVFFIAGTALFVHQNRNIFMILVGLLLISFPITEISVGFPIDSDLTEAGVFVYSHPLAYGVVALETYTYWSFVTFWLLFPKNNLQTSWIRFVLSLWTFLCLAWMVIPTIPFNIIHGDTWDKTPVASSLVSLFIFGSVLLLQLYRYVMEYTRLERQQSKWILFGFSCIFLAGILRHRVGGLLDMGVNGWIYGQPVLVILSTIFALSFILAITQNRLWDIDILISRSLIALLLFIIVTFVYTLVIGLFSDSFADAELLFPSIIATGLVALGFENLRVLVRRNINRLVYGYPHEIDEITRLMSNTIAKTEMQSDLPSQIAAMFKNLIKLQYIAIQIQDSRSVNTIAYLGIQPKQTRIFTIDSISDEKIHIIVGSRFRHELFSPRELKFLNIMVQHVSPALKSYLLTREVQRSQQQVVIGREEILSAVGQKIHDEISNPLGKLSRQFEDVLQFGGIVEEYRVESEKYHKNLIHIHKQARDMSHNIYNSDVVIYGLVEAIQELAREYHNPPNALRVNLLEPPILPPLSLAHEFTIFRIISNGLDNVSKHAQGANACWIAINILEIQTDQEYRALFDKGVRIRTATYLRITVDDDGNSWDIDYTTIRGKGLTSIKRSAQELGGICYVQTSNKYGGTQLVAYMPVSEEVDPNGAN